MDKNSVTRTFSIGAICNGVKASDEVSTARRHSSAGVRALMWATSSAKSFGSSLGSESQTSRENIFPNILTPDSIPQFMIPSLSVQNSFRSLDKETKEDYSESKERLRSSGTKKDSSSPACSTRSSSSSLSSGLSLALFDRRAERSVSDPFSQRRSFLQREVSHACSYREVQHCQDPASRAAFSLPHLAKVTTPYGFITLSQSPQMASEEALLCKAGLRRLNKEETAVCFNKPLGLKTVDIKGTSSHLLGDKKKLSREQNDSQNTESVQEVTKAASPLVKNVQHKRFYKIIRKHFTSLGMKQCD